jgi:hypothetical protein
MNKNLLLFRVVEVPRAISSALVHFVLHAANNQRSRNLIVQDFVKGVCKYELKRLKCCGLNYMQRQELVDPVANRPTLQITAFRLYSHSIPPIFVIKSMPKCRVLKRIDGQWCFLVASSQCWYIGFYIRSLRDNLAQMGMRATDFYNNQGVSYGGEGVRLQGEWQQSMECGHQTQ